MFLKCQVEEISQNLEVKCKGTKIGTENRRDFLDGQMRSYVYIIINLGQQRETDGGVSEYKLVIENAYELKRTEPTVLKGLPRKIHEILPRIYSYSIGESQG